MHIATLSDPISSLWAAARAIFVRMIGVIGEPRALRENLEPDAKTLARVRAWLRPLEAVVRKIVLVEAAALARTLAPQPEPRLTSPTRFAPKTPYPQPRPHRGRFRLWPRSGPRPRIRLLGPPTHVREIWREQIREAQVRQLALVRFMRPPEPVLLAGRIEALARVLHKPLPAIRRLARKLRRSPRLAYALAVTRWPRSPHADPHLQDVVIRHACDSAKELNDSS
ncbi:MAG TPA: hypothetical protein VEA80_07280 [Vitreimonas sp.]|uniref:hypothetical protein n=1 Tax=Vitreimonas sp. TaxID=3069702 RepID=UPI002D748C77|nr:hypothetical protein [Vitreimonas sp.]HYD87259.1 hypothetical protein [Vitreimonas sp.]